MKTLVIIRHAKSDWGNENLEDFYRPLNTRGNTDAPRMAERLKELGITPDCFLTSPAIRAYTTAQFFAATFNAQDRIVLQPRLYEGSLRDYTEVIGALPGSIQTALVFGHNPIITELVNQLGDLRTDNVPTCGMAGFRVKSWNEKGDLLFYEYPKKSPA